MKEYKIAVMGATGSGKTVFFGSYFNSVINQGSGNFSVSPATPDSIKEISRITTTLFEERLPVMGTAERTDISFNVPSLEMRVILHDIPGGYTQDVDQWVEQKITPDLESANGVLFFISGEDLVYHREKCDQDNAAFTAAIDHLRKKQKGAAREDVPVWFLFTKGDLIPNVTLEDLKNAIKGLRRTAEESRQDYVFKTGRNVRFYKVISLGKWKDSNSLPEEYQPENVLESMEELLKTVKGSVNRHRHVLLGLAAVIAMLSYLVTVGGLWWFDQSRWNSVLETVNREVALSHYDNALQSVNSFPGRLLPPSWLLPPFLRVNAAVEATREGIYVQYEKAMYDALRSDVEGVDVNKIPNTAATQRFDAVADKVHQYLDKPDFYKADPRHYNNVKAVEAYYAIGQMMLSRSKEEGTELETPQDILGILKKALDLVSQIPESWRDEFAVKVDEYTRLWANAVSREATVEGLKTALLDMELLVSHPRMPAGLVSFLEGQKEKFANELTAAWTKRCDEWLREAQTRTPEEAIEMLLDRQRGSDLPPEVLEHLGEALNQYYARIVDSVVSGEDEKKLQEVLSRYPTMPDEQKIRLGNRQDALARENTARVVHVIEATNRIDALTPLVNEIKDVQKRYSAEVTRPIEDALLRIVERDVDTLKAEWAKKINEKDYTLVKQDIEDNLKTLSSLPVLDSLSNALDMRKAIEERKKTELEQLCEYNFADCKNKFESIRNTMTSNDIEGVLATLRGFKSRWTSQVEKQGEVNAVIEFLEHIKNGIDSSLVIVEGNFEAEAFFGDAPDMFIKVDRGKESFTRTNTVKDKPRPIFNWKYEFKWDVQTELTFSGIEEDPMSNDEVFEAIVSATGLFGYKKLTGTLRDKSNTLTIRLDPKKKIPYCPWE